ncbi:MAG: 3'(2'),5'-bisphosphate nucleotidase CysQ, partial [Rhodobacteraceae bacterium]|nr:3'(2'),5'-bisphosphate nucleotidase CysQ [Paracoccaceae bacterium]
MTTELHEKIESTFRAIALKAGEVIMEVYGRPDFEARSKSDNSPVTEADEAADAVIRAELAVAFPDIAVVTEELSESHSIQADRFIIVDPLDGTKEFVQ